MGAIRPYKPRNRKYKITPLWDRFIWKFKVDLKTGCWNWGGGTSAGYGTIFLAREKGTTRQFVTGAHRVSYMFFRGPIPDDKEIDHRCRNRRCVNPDHLRAVSRRENSLLGEGVSAIAMSKTHCPKGHPYDDENTYYDKRNGHRHCKACGKIKDYYKSKTHRKGTPVPPIPSILTPIDS